MDAMEGAASGNDWETVYAMLLVQWRNSVIGCIAMENSHRNSDFPMKKGDFH